MIEIKDPNNPIELDAERERLKQEDVRDGVRWVKEYLNKKQTEEKKKEEETKAKFKAIQDSLKDTLKDRNELVRMTKEFVTDTSPALRIFREMGVDVFKEIKNLPSTLKNIKDPDFWEKTFKDTRTDVQKAIDRMEKRDKLVEELGKSSKETLLGSLSNISPIFKLFSQASAVFGKSKTQKIKEVGQLSEPSTVGPNLGLGDSTGIRGGIKGILTQFVFSNDFRRALDDYNIKMVKGLHINEDGTITYTKQAKPKMRPKIKKPELNEAQIAEEAKDKLKQKSFINSSLANMAKYKGLPFPPQALAGAAPYILAGAGIAMIAMFLWKYLEVLIERKFGNPKEFIKKATVGGGAKTAVVDALAARTLAAQALLKGDFKGWVKYGTEAGKLQLLGTAEAVVGAGKGLGVLGKDNAAEESVEDAIIRKDGSIIRTNPDDNIIATKSVPAFMSDPDTTISKDYTSDLDIIKRMITELREEVKRQPSPQAVSQGPSAFSGFMDQYAKGNI